MKAPRIIHYDFKDRSPDDLEQLNRKLRTMKFRELTLRNHKGYLEVTRDGEGNLISQRYGLGSGTLVGQEDPRGYVYQIDTAVTDPVVSQDEFADIWRSIHSDRAMRVLIRASCGGCQGYVILHHQKVQMRQSNLLPESKDMEKDVKE